MFHLFVDIIQWILHIEIVKKAFRKDIILLVRYTISTKSRIENRWKDCWKVENRIFFYSRIARQTSKHIRKQTIEFKHMIVFRIQECHDRCKIQWHSRLNHDTMYKMFDQIIWFHREIVKKSFSKIISMLARFTTRKENFRSHSRNRQIYFCCFESRLFRFNFVVRYLEI